MLRFLLQKYGTAGVPWGLSSILKQKNGLFYQCTRRLRHVSNIYKFLELFPTFGVFLFNIIKRFCGQNGNVIAIRREDQSVWERRAAFAPSHVSKMVKQGIKVIVQPSNRRAYPMQVSDGEGYTTNKTTDAFRRFHLRLMMWFLIISKI